MAASPTLSARCPQRAAVWRRYTPAKKKLSRASRPKRGGRDLRRPAPAAARRPLGGRAPLPSGQGEGLEARGLQSASAPGLKALASKATKSSSVHRNPLLAFSQSRVAGAPPPSARRKSAAAVAASRAGLALSSAALSAAAAALAASAAAAAPAALRRWAAQCRQPRAPRRLLPPQRARLRWSGASKGFLLPHLLLLFLGEAAVAGTRVGFGAKRSAAPRTRQPRTTPARHPSQKPSVPQ